VFVEQICFFLQLFSFTRHLESFVKHLWCLQM
jgi:hypothetical protein